MSSSVKARAEEETEMTGRPGTGAAFCRYAGIGYARENYMEEYQMKIIDITRTVQEAPMHPGSAGVEVKQDMIEEGGHNAGPITAGSHTGTHADAFSRFLTDSDVTIDKMPLENYCGKCRVISVPENALVTMEDVRGRIDGAERLVIHGGGGTFLCEEAAEYIAACRLKAVVTDAVSVAPSDNEESIHSILFEAGVAVIENAVLDGVEDGEYLIFAFPVKCGGCDGAPVRAVLLSR